MQRDPIHQVHAISARGERQRVHPGAAANVENQAWRRREKPLEDVERSDVFQPPKRDGESLLFFPATIEVENLLNDLAPAD